MIGFGEESSRPRNEVGCFVSVTPASLNKSSWYLPWFSTAFSPYNGISLGDADAPVANVTRFPYSQSTAERFTSMHGILIGDQTKLDPAGRRARITADARCSFEFRGRSSAFVIPHKLYTTSSLASSLSSPSSAASSLRWSTTPKCLHQGHPCLILSVASHPSQGN